MQGRSRGRVPQDHRGHGLGRDGGGAAPPGALPRPDDGFYDRDAIDLEGRRAIVEFWRASSEGSGTSRIDYTYRACFETAGYHVVHYDLTVTVAGEYWNVDRATIDLSGAVTSIIRIVDDRVVEHRDYVDYAAAEETIAELRRRYGTIDG